MPVPRKRSCAQCRRAKTRCSLTIPHCTRCISRNLDCDYVEALPRDVTSGVTPMFLGTPEVPASVIQLQPPAEINTTFSDLLEEVVHAPPELQSESIPLQWEDANPFPENDDWVDYPFMDLSGAFPPEEPDVTLIAERYYDFKADSQEYSYLIDISRKLALPHDIMTPWPVPKGIPNRFKRLLDRRSPDMFGSSLIANHIFATFTSYPTMLGHSDLPPFIHRHGYDNDQDMMLMGNTYDFPEPLANCVSFLSMFHSKSKASEFFVMRTLFGELQRLRNEFASFEMHTKLAAIHALVIYSIIIANENDRCTTLSTVIVLVTGELTAVLYQTYAALDVSEGDTLSWKDWKFIESIRRTMIVMWLFNSIVDMNIGVSKPGSCYLLDAIPLPCSKDIWEASSQSEWEKRYGRYKASRKSKDVMKVGDLRAIQHMETASMANDARAADLKLWSSNVDALGSTLMLALANI